MKPKRLVLAIIIVSIAVGLFVFLPLPYSHHAPFVIEPVETISVSAATEGFLTKIFVKEGDTVTRGALMAVMRQQDLEEKRNSFKTQIAIMGRSIMVQRAQGAVAESLVAEHRRTQLNQQLADIDAQLARLNITAPDDGVVVTPKVEQKVGVMLKQGDQFCEITKSGLVQARIRIDDWDLEDVGLGAPATLWLNALHGRTINGHITRLAPASDLHQRLSSSLDEQALSDSEGKTYSGEGTVVKASSGATTPNSKRSTREEAEAGALATSPFVTSLTRFDALIQIAADPTLKPGMSGVAKVYGPNRPLAVTLWRGIRDWFRSRVWW